MFSATQFTAHVTERLLVEVVGIPPLTSVPRQDAAEWKTKTRTLNTKSGPIAEINDRYIIRDRACKIHREPTIPHFNRFEPRRSRDLKKWKQHQPDRFAIPFVAYQACLPVVRQIGVPFIIALVLMMFQVINAKTHRTRSPDWEIGNEGDHFVPARLRKSGCVSRRE